MAPPSWVAWSFLILIVVICLALSAFVSGSEIAYFGLSRSEVDELEESDDKKDQEVFRLIKDPERLLATILIANNLVNITMVVVTHEMGFARQVADRVIFMDDGRILEEGSPEHFFVNPTEERTKAFLSKIL